jgi:tetratricopeptide (TPR) repeat protein
VARDFARSRLVNLAALHGQAREWRRLVDLSRSGAERERAVPTVANVNGEAFMMSRYWADGAPVVRALDSAIAAVPPAAPRGQLQHIAAARTYARAGAPAKARAMLQRYDVDIVDTVAIRTSAPSRRRSMGDILLAEGRYSDAIAEFRAADALYDGPATECTLCLISDMARVYDAAGMVDSAIARYEQVIATPYSTRLGQFDAPALARQLRRLGALYEQKGNNEKAIEYYQKFADLWKNADPEFQPEVIEAKRRISALSATSKGR